MLLLPTNIVNISAAITQQVQVAGNCSDAVLTDVLRLDKIDPVISGNKWFKLKYYLQAAVEQNRTSVLTFGGAWSNHIVATACAAKKAGLQSIGMIRGEAPAAYSASLQTALSWGMRLVFVTREQYNQKNNPAFIQQLADRYSNAYIIPEGGEGELGIKGASEITNLVNKESYTHIICALGTGTQLAGIVQGTDQQQIIGIAVLKGFDNWHSPFIAAEMHRVRIVANYHLGGYAKKNAVLLSFMNSFYEQTGIATDWVYTGKLFYAVDDLLKKDYFPAGSRLLIIHSGGLQGNSSLEPGTLNF